MMLSLGNYRFSLDTAAYQSKSRTTSYRWSKQNRLGGNPALQFLGPDEDNITLPGIIYPHYKGGFGQLDAMRKEADKGEPLLLITGKGVVLGHWAIKSITENEDTFEKDGTSKKIEFSIEIQKDADPTGGV
ncbi:hypothetical protein IMCC1989_2526 [gamma proteobacterium IMCC1989]|nr:hypothetical protein IMCC1989_2526 [gamma proteobacterium IMCC1989]